MNHVYNSMQCIKYENDFAKYYDKNYDFVKVNLAFQLDLIIVCLITYLILILNLYNNS